MNSTETTTSWEQKVGRETIVEWLSSGVSETIIDRNVVDLEFEDALHIIFKKELEKLGAHSKQYTTGELAEVHKKADFLQSGGWWCSGLDPFANWGVMEWGQFKPRTPRIDPKKRKKIKYETPRGFSARVFFLDPGEPNYWPTVLGDKSIPLVLTEGCKKAGLLLSCGFAAVALPGISMGYRKRDEALELIPELELFNDGRPLIICFDQDSKISTRAAVESIHQQFLDLWKGETRSTSWDFRLGKGIDDIGLDLSLEERHAKVKAIIAAALPVEPPPLPNLEQSSSRHTALIELAKSAMGFIPPFKQSEGRYHESWVWMTGLIASLGDDGKILIRAWDRGRGEWGMSIDEKIQSLEPRDSTIASLFHVARKHGWQFPDEASKKEWENRSKELEAYDQEDEGANKALYIKVKRRLGGVIRWNKLKHSIEVDGEELASDFLRMQLAIKYGIQIAAKDLAEEVCLMLAKENEYHPVVQYFDRVASIYPANDELLNSIASKYMHVDEPLYREYLRKWLISVVARTYQPGCKVDTVLTLQGGQGIYKSTFFKSLCQDDEWFDDSYTGQLSDKDEKLKFHFSLICEWAELDQIFKRRDAAACKNVISSSSDKVRPPYARKQGSYPRPSVIVSTANSSELLDDPTGDRRWWIIPLKEAIDNDAVKRDRDQIWAAAIHAYRAGEAWYLSPEFEELRAESNERFNTQDTWEEVCFQWIENRFDPLEPFTTRQIMEEGLKIDPERQEKHLQKRLGQVLRRLGYDNSRRDYNPKTGARDRVWTKIENPNGQMDQMDQKAQNNDTQPKTNDPLEPENLIQKNSNGSDSPQILIHDPLDPLDPLEKKSSAQPEKNEDFDPPNGSKISPPQIQEPTMINPGDRVIPNGTARWIRKGSQPLPKLPELSRFRDKDEISLSNLEGALFLDLTSLSRVIEVSPDGQRVKVMSSGGRKSVFYLEDLNLYA